MKSASELLTDDKEEVAAYKKSSDLMNEINDILNAGITTKEEVAALKCVPVALVTAAAIGNFSEFLAAQRAE
jgi:hypothetical protein